MQRVLRITVCGMCAAIALCGCNRGEEKEARPNSTGKTEARAPQFNTERAKRSKPAATASSDRTAPDAGTTASVETSSPTAVSETAAAKANADAAQANMPPATTAPITPTPPPPAVPVMDTLTSLRDKIDKHTASTSAYEVRAVNVKDDVYNDLRSIVNFGQLTPAGQDIVAKYLNERLPPILDSAEKAANEESYTQLAGSTKEMLDRMQAELQQAGTLPPQ